MSIKESAQSLMLAYTASNYSSHVKEAAHTGMPHDEFLEELLLREVEYRRANRLKKRITAARFPYQKYLVDFDRTPYEKKTATLLQSFFTLEFIQNQENLILIGNPGVGKTHLAIALGIEACMKDLRVLYATVPNLVIELREAMSLNQVTAYRKKFEKFDLVILDELGYVSFDKESNDILFNLLSSRKGHGSMIITSNLVFERWVEVFHDPLLTGALVDRLAHISYVVDMSADSYRIRETKQWMARKVAPFSTD